MKKMKKTVYVTDDGVEFDTAIDARRHEQQEEFKTRYEIGSVSRLYALGNPVKEDALCAWLVENRLAVIQLLS